MSDERLETPKQLAARVNLSERQVRRLIQTGRLQYLMIGCRVHIPSGAFERFVQEGSVKPWRDEIRDHAYVGLINANASTSSGRSTVAAASAQLARQNAKKLKSCSVTGSKREASAAAHVIPPRSS